MTDETARPAASSDRRPIASREKAVFKRVASWLARRGVSPNAISLSSIVFAAAAAGALIATPRLDGPAQRLAWIAAAVCVQLRLLANLFDGMVALEKGPGSAVGELYNEVPDRVADTLILVGAGFAAGGEPLLGALAAVVSVFVAYIRAMGAALGAGQVFVGPFAKPHRMFLVTIAALFAGLAPSGWTLFEDVGLMSLVLAVIVVGGTATAWRRLARIVSVLREGRP